MYNAPFRRAIMGDLETSRRLARISRFQVSAFQDIILRKGGPAISVRLKLKCVSVSVHQVLQDGILILFKEVSKK